MSNDALGVVCFSVTMIFTGTINVFFGGRLSIAFYNTIILYVKAIQMRDHRCVCVYGLFAGNNNIYIYIYK